MEYSLMLKKALALVGLTLSLTANALIVDLGNITRDTISGLDWLDLTETNGRSYNDISGKLGTGQEFEGWRYATVVEVQALWKEFGLINGVFDPIYESDLTQYQAFIYAVTLLGNTFNEWKPEWYDYGAVGITADTYEDPFSPDSPNLYQYGNGLYHAIDTDSWDGDSYVYRSTILSDGANTRNGSYLVYQNSPPIFVPPEVPVPAAAWLFGSALLGLAGIRRKK